MQEGGEVYDGGREDPGGEEGGGALFPPAAPLSNDFPGATSAPTGPGRAAYSLHANLITLGQPASLPAVQSKAKQKSQFSFGFALLWLVFNRSIFLVCESLHVENLCVSLNSIPHHTKIM